MDYLTTQYDYSESSICRIISTIEQILINCEKLTVKGKNKLKNLKNTKLVIDVTESEIERPKKNQKDYYSDKKKKHTFKTQVLANIDTGEIYSIDVSKCKTHDFQMDSEIVLYNSNTIIADSGYQGIQNIHSNSIIPEKKVRNLQRNRKIIIN